MKHFVVMLAATAFAAPARAQQGPAAGDFTSYVFALEWMPQFCVKASGAAECRALNSNSFAATHPVLHGLWPNQSNDPNHAYGYCGAAAAEIPLDKNTTWCRLPLPALSNAARARLSQYMPGTQSCLQNHEWTRHGTCSGLTADAYFSEEADLASAVDASSFGAYLTQNAGGFVDRDAVLAQFDAAYGAGTSASVTLHCAAAAAGDESDLMEIHVNLAPALQPASRLAAMLAEPDASDATDCPSSFRLLPAR